MTAAQAEMFPDLPTIELPKRVRRKWDELNQLCDLVKEHGQLVPLTMAADLLDLSHQRVYQLKDLGILVTVEYQGRQWVGERTIRAFVEHERKTGRPVKDPSVKDAWKAARKFAKSAVKK